ncbi:Calcium-transporting ATPase 3, endoplasmic reticulum-type [Trebouxia sp. C0010 RCD-2024]
MEDAFARDASEVLRLLNVDPGVGLSDAEVVEARAKYGSNEQPPEKGTPFWKLVLKQFDDLLVKILIVAAVVDFGIALLNGESGANAFVEPGVIVMILVANATVGVVTETNAEKAIEELKAYEADVATVLRKGRLHVVPASQLVPGDIVEVAVGCKVPADLRLTEVLSSVIRVDQSILTGESSSVEKNTESTQSRKAVYQDKTCLLFAGTVVTAGRARAVVVCTGPSTAMGKIRHAMTETDDEMTPLKKKLDEFGTFLSKAIAVICVLVWIINIGHFNDPIHGGWVQGALYYFKIAVALAVAAIPEGLPAVVTTCLALGTRKMAKKNAIVRSLPSVETLGCTTVICSDKTGTLTTNQMAVARIAVVQSPKQELTTFEVTGNTYAPEGGLYWGQGHPLDLPPEQPCLLKLAVCSALCNDSSLSFAPDKGVYQRVGEATELALRVLTEKIGLPGYGSHALDSLSRVERATYCNDHWQQSYKKISTLEFSRDRKMMSVLAQGPNNQGVIFAKGAPESILQKCSHVLSNNGSGVSQMSEGVHEGVMAAVSAFGSQQALRCLALAYKNHSGNSTKTSKADESDLTLIGVVGMHDPPRREVPGAIALCKAAGIRLIVVTGDNKATAQAVCAQVGAIETSAQPSAVDPILTGLEFDDLPAVEKAEAVSMMSVFARVEPSHKSRLVELLKAQGHVVAMTGDGVNDAPALKKADIGIAMGSGTAVAKHAADMVLADDNFASIVAAVAEGRAIFNNTKQFIRYMVSSNIGEVVAIFFAALLGMPETLNPVQLLWVNLVTDGLPATALGFNAPDEDIMRQKPRRMSDSIVSRWLIVRYMVVGVYVGCATVAGFAWWYMYYAAGPRLTWRQLTDFQNCKEGSSAFSCDLFKDRHPSTISMTVLVVVEMFNALNALSENNSLLQLPPWSNLWLLAAIAVSMMLHVFIMYTPPIAKVFTVTALSGTEWAAVLWLSFPVIMVDEFLKFLSRNLTLGHVPLPKLVRRLSHSKDLLLPTHSLHRQGSHEK